MTIMQKVLLKLTKKQIEVLESMYLEAIADYQKKTGSQKKYRDFMALMASIDKQIRFCPLFDKKDQNE